LQLAHSVRFEHRGRSDVRDARAGPQQAGSSLDAQLFARKSRTADGAKEGLPHLLNEALFAQREHKLLRALLIAVLLMRTGLAR
jgi:hypothetical protein